MGLIRCSSKAAPPISLILGIVSFEPDDGALAFKRQNMGCDPIEEPAVMADHRHRAGKIFEGLLQCSKGVHIQAEGT